MRELGSDLGNRRKAETHAGLERQRNEAGQTNSSEIKRGRNTGKAERDLHVCRESTHGCPPSCLKNLLLTFSLFIILPRPRRGWGLGPPPGHLALAVRSLGHCAEEEPSPQRNLSRRGVTPSPGWEI